MRHKSILTFSVMLVVAVAACGGSRPNQAAWLGDWNRISAIVPDRSTVSDEMSPIVCEDILASLRSETSSLTPTPEPSLDRTVSEWIEVTQSAFFECPPDNGGFAVAYDEIEHLEAEVAAVVSSDD